MKTPLTQNAATRLWNDFAPELGVVIANKLRKMRFPPAQTGGPTGELLRSRGYGEVRMMLLSDRQLHQDIRQAVADQFWSGVLRGQFRADSTAGILVTITQRTTRRIAAARAKELLRRVAPIAEGSVFDDASTAKPSPNPAHDMDLRRNWQRLVPLLRQLDPTDLRVLIAKIEGEGSYQELAHELGKTEGALRTRAHRLCKRLRHKLENESGREQSAP